MRARPVDFDWQILDESEQEEWPPRLPTGDRIAGQGRRAAQGHGRMRLLLFGLAACLMLSGLAAGMGVIGRADQAMTRVEADLAAAVAVDAALGQAAPLRLQAEAAGDQVTVRRVEVHGDLALVDVVVTGALDPWLPSAYRQTVCYRESDLGWRRAAPAAELWGSPAVYRTKNFRFEYRSRDAEAVHAAAVDIDEFDAALRHDFGLPPRLPTDERLTIAIGPGATAAVDPANLYFAQSGAVLSVPSPSLLPVPAELSDGEALRQLVAGLLARRALDDALRNTPPAATWQPLVDGLALWLRNEQMSLPSQERTCHEQELQWELARGWIPHLRDVQYSSPSLPSTCLAPVHGRLSPQVVAATLVEYSVVTYGRDQLSALLAGMHRFHRWEDMVPAVYRVTVQEFESGWQAYLAVNQAPSSSSMLSSWATSLPLVRAQAPRPTDLASRTVCACDCILGTTAERRP